MSVVVPVYNEENGIKPFLDRTEAVVNELGCRYEIIFSLDPSTDRTYEVIKENMARNKNIKLITMSRRFRQAAATMAGVLNCTGDICVVIDVDLQDPPEVIYDLVDKWKEGYDVSCKIDYFTNSCLSLTINSLSIHNIISFFPLIY